MADLLNENYIACETYYKSLNLGLSVFFLRYFIAKCVEDSSGMGGVGGSAGIDDLLTVVANDYFNGSLQIVLLYDESWDISDMIMKLTVTSNKAFVSYFLPLDENIGKRIRTNPPDHITHKLLPKADAFLVFVKDENGFANILRLMAVYPWWNKRARVVVMVKEKGLLPTKGILELMEAEKIFNGVVVTAITNRGDTADSDQSSLQNLHSTTNSTGDDTEKKLGPQLQLQLVALDPYPEDGHSKDSYVGRWVNGELQTFRSIFQEKISDLRGFELQVCVFEFPPLVIKNEIKPNVYEYTGLEVGLLRELSRLINFTYSFYEPPEGERWGTDLGNNTWTGLIGETQRKADFGFASVFLLDNREKAVDVSTPYDQDQGCFATPRPEALQHWLGLVLPFSWQVWACIISMAIVAGPIFTLITRPLGMDKSLTVARGIFYALGSLVSAQKPPHAKSHALRTFIVSWLIYCWLACILYRVALIVSLTVGPSAFKIDSLKQLARSSLEWGGYPEVLKTFTNTTDAADERLFDRFQLVTNTTEALERVANKGDFALLESGKLLRYAQKGRYFNGYSSMIHVTKDCPTRYNVGIVMPIGSPFLERVNELIRRLQNAGLIEKWYQDILHQAAIKNANKKQRPKKKEGLGIQDLKLCLVLVGGGHLAAFLALIGENLLDYYRTGRTPDVKSIIRKVSTISGLSLFKGSDHCPSGAITDTESIRSDSLHSLPVEMERGWDKDASLASAVENPKPLSCPPIKHFDKNNK